MYIDLFQLSYRLHCMSVYSWVSNSAVCNSQGHTWMNWSLLHQCVNLMVIQFDWIVRILAPPTFALLTNHSAALINEQDTWELISTGACPWHQFSHRSFRGVVFLRICFFFLVFTSSKILSQKVVLRSSPSSRFAKLSNL